MPQHVVQRGLDRHAVFFEDADYEHYLDVLSDSAESYRMLVHAYCLMTNHVHLLVTPQERDSVPHAMRRLGSQYVRFANRRYGRSGTLWDGRYRASLVDSDTYFLVCQRYIELNPVRAGMVVEPGAYRWSSFACNALGTDDGRVVPHAVYRDLGVDEAARREAYRALFAQAMDSEQVEAVRAALQHNHALGSDRFKRQVESMLGRKLGTGRPGRPAKPPLQESGAEEQGELPL